MSAESSQKGQILVMYVLAFTPLFYALLLFLLGTIQSPVPVPSDDPFRSTMNLLKYIFLIVIVLEIIFSQLIFIPKIADLPQKMQFGNMLVAMAVNESIAIFALLYGLLQLFMLGDHVDWLYVGLLFFLSIMLLLYNVQSSFKPLLSDDEL